MLLPSLVLLYLSSSLPELRQGLSLEWVIKVSRAAFQTFRTHLFLQRSAASPLPRHCLCCPLFPLQMHLLQPSASLQSQWRAVILCRLRRQPDLWSRRIMSSRRLGLEPLRRWRQFSLPPFRFRLSLYFHSHLSASSFSVRQAAFRLRRARCWPLQPAFEKRSARR